MDIIIGNKKYSHIELPNICPHCHVINNPSHIFNQPTKDTDNTECNLSIWKCANLKCNKLFVVVYKIEDSIPKLEKYLNGLPKGPEWPIPITELKSGNKDESNQTKFIKTYLQSLEAESRGLDELAGMGFRKAIEYLVKDWAIQNNPDDVDKIETSWLGAVINGYFKGDLKDILERATWLGNDQAHYNRLFEEFDIAVLKELIDLVMVELDRQYKMSHYIKLINSKK